MLAIFIRTFLTKPIITIIGKLACKEGLKQPYDTHFGARRRRGV